MARKVVSAQVKRDLAALADPRRAETLAWFFKTGPGEYGEGDRFLGITVPLLKKVAAKYRLLPLKGVARLLNSSVHEHRSVGLAILVLQFKKGTPEEQEDIVDFYLRHTGRINNWDLVDSSAPYLLGVHLAGKSRDVLYRLVKSPNLWERRIAIVSTLTFIKAGETRDVYRLAEQLLDDKHDLIHKAVGWALRESGKISRPALLRFLKRHYKRIPRTTLRYAIEHLPAPERKGILLGSFPASTNLRSLKRKSPPE